MVVGYVCSLFSHFWIWTSNTLTLAFLIVMQLMIKLQLRVLRLPLSMSLCYYLIKCPKMFYSYPKYIVRKISCYFLCWLMTLMDIFFELFLCCLHFASYVRYNVAIKCATITPGIAEYIGKLTITFASLNAWTVHAHNWLNSWTTCTIFGERICTNFIHRKKL